MTHEEARALLPGYAAGILGDAASAAVRAHLAEGCVECLQDLYSRPVGLPADQEPEPPPAAAPRAVAWRAIAVVAVVALVVVVVGASTIVGVASRPGAPARDSANVDPTLAELQQLRAALALRLTALENAAASAATASREAEESRSSMSDMRRELEASRLRIAALKRAMRRQDVDFEEKRRSMEAMIARLSGHLPVTGTAGPARQTQALTPCEESHLDLWSFRARQGRQYTVTADTVDAASAADLCLVGACDGAAPFAADDELPCRSAPGFGCPRATFVATADTTCLVAVTICSPGCGNGRSARYELSVEGAESLALVADDVSSITGETADAF